MATPTTVRSAPHLLACRAAFAKDVVPNFAGAEARFERYFCDSYALLNSPPRQLKGKLSVSFALTVLGVKCFDVLPPDFYPALMRVEPNILPQLGLQHRRRDSGELEIFSPGLLEPVLSEFFHGRADNSASINFALQSFQLGSVASERNYPYALLAWPSLFPKGNGADATMMSMNVMRSGSICWPSARDDAAANSMKVLRAVELAEQILGFRKIAVSPLSF
jgi:hypothetical protein